MKICVLKNYPVHLYWPCYVVSRPVNEKHHAGNSSQKAELHRVPVPDYLFAREKKQGAQ